jgi:O-Antigen ligase
MTAATLDPAARRLWLGRALLATLAATVLAHGGASTVELDFAALGFALLALLAAATPIAAPRLAWLQALALLLLAALLAFAFWQTLPHSDSPFVDSAWRTLGDAILGVSPRGSISVAPGLTLAAAPALAAPFLAFAVALACCQNDEEALRLWRGLAYFGAVYAAFGIVQEVFWPDQLLLEPKRFYLGDLTASFVNRNTAGTFFGVALLLNLALLFADLRGARLARQGKRSGRSSALLVHLFAVLDCAAALFLTRSRGAIGATLIATLVATAMTAARRLTSDRARDDVFARWRRPAVVLAALALVLGLFILFAGRSEHRAQGLASEDGRWCVYRSTIAAIADHWPLGAGFGAFPDVFPAYRNADCAGAFGIWDHAHDFFLEGLLGFGLPFVAATALVYATLGAALIRGARVRRRLRNLPVAGLAALVLVTLHAIVDFSLQIPGVAVYVAAAIAAAVAAALGRAGENAGRGGLHNRAA